MERHAFDLTGSCNLRQAADDINVLAAFLGRRDVDDLTPEALERSYGFSWADVMVLFGGSILAGADVLASAMRGGVARHYVIAGGAGHTTESLRETVRCLAPDVDFAPDASEADVFASYLGARYDLVPDLLERSSTNCGNNITNLLDLLAFHGIAARTMIVCQDATMQLRMQAGLARKAPDMVVAGFASYSVRVVVREGRLDFAKTIPGMWDLPRYLTLLMGEIPRLRDDAAGYGPNGTGYIAHVDIPREVEDAFERLRQVFPGSVRTANTTFASR